MSDVNEWRPYDHKTYRVPILLDVRAGSDREAFERIKRVSTMLADREDVNLAQVGFRTKEAREHIAGAVVYIDSMREVVGPAPSYPLPSLQEMVDATIPPHMRKINPAQTVIEGTENSGTDVPQK